MIFLFTISSIVSLDAYSNNTIVVAPMKTIDDIVNGRLMLA
jgi:hypothetical protein